jgi:hypothetical protein
MGRIFESLNKNNGIFRLKALDSIGRSYEREIDFTTSHLMNVDSSSIFQILSRIFGHSSLRLQSEDRFYEQIPKQISRDGEKFSLLEFVG